MAVREKEERMKLSDIWRKGAERDLAKTIKSAMPRDTRRNGGDAAADLLKGLYTGANQNFNLAAGFTYPAVSVVKQLAGVPLLGDEWKELQTYLFDEGAVITQTMLVNGTAWRWARWSDRLRRLVWECIPDGAIGSRGLETDADTGEILRVNTDENIAFNVRGFQENYARRKRFIDRETIEEEWTGGVVQFTKIRNPFGFMPLPFGHDCWENEWRGNSIYGRVLRLIADMHGIRRNRDEILSQFRPKMIQTVENTDRWYGLNKEYTDQKYNEVYSPFEADFVLNRKEDRTEYLNIGSDATAQHTAAIEDNRKEAVIASGLPEIFFGQIATGNAASTDSQILLGIEYIKEIRREMTRAYKILLNQSAHILSYTRFETAAEIDVNWDDLSMVGPEAKSRIMANYAGAVSQLLSNGSVSKEGALYMTRLLYPDWPEDDAAAYLAGINETLVEHSSKIGAQPFEMGDLGGAF
jgi:hypothetical protein